MKKKYSEISAINEDVRKYRHLLADLFGIKLIFLRSELIVATF